MAHKVIMVSPTAFHWNYESAADNSFMHHPQHNHESTRAQIVNSHNNLVACLRENGIEVTLFDHKEEEKIPEAVFPNNWFSTHGNCFVLYPMKHPTRRGERRPHIIETFRKLYPVEIDLTHWENDDLYLEGTGALVLDRNGGKVYCVLSQRSSEIVARDCVEQLSAQLGRPLELILFAAKHNGVDIYHTNVMLAIGTHVAVCCLESITDQQERKLVEEALGNKKIVDISIQQMNNFCGNIIELCSKDGNRMWVMSTKAYNAFTPEQREVLETEGTKIIHVPLDDLERLGGGGVRCCIAEAI